MVSTKDISIYMENVYRAALKDKDDLIVSRSYYIDPNTRKTMPHNQYIVSIISIGPATGAKYCSSMYEFGPDGYCEVWDRK